MKWDGTWDTIPLRVLRQLIRDDPPGPVRAYAKLALSFRGNRGCRLSPEDVDLILTGDDAITAALCEAACDIEDAEGTSPESIPDRHR